jgi:sulfate adenylyltransferase subunit 2
MLAFRDRRAAELGLDLIVHVNEEVRRAGIGPFTHGAALHTQVMKRHGFDAALGGARRDEEKSRAKERIFSFRRRAIAGMQAEQGKCSGDTHTGGYVFSDLPG